MLVEHHVVRNKSTTALGVTRSLTGEGLHAHSVLIGVELGASLCLKHSDVVLHHAIPVTVSQSPASSGHKIALTNSRRIFVRRKTEKEHQSYTHHPRQHNALKCLESEKQHPT